MAVSNNGKYAQTMFGIGYVSHAAVNATGSGNNQIVAAVAGKKIVVLGCKIVASGAVTVAWESGGGTILDGPCAFGANGGESSTVDDGGLFATATGEALVLNLSSAVQVGGRVKYVTLIPNALTE